ncbi:MAG: DUF29 domain-containing protein [Cyanosarcina radialis HA8281-LM2]|nr:DUF29 domain-containing protein [Cyanosarcina radialis HA8281-LM2]
MPNCYADAREDALAKTDLQIDNLLTESPFTFAEIIDL